MKTTKTLISLALLAMTSVAAAQQPVPANRQLGLDAADQYRQQARFPRSSHPVADGVDPIMAKREISKQVLPGPNGEGPMLGVWASSISYEPGETALLYAQIVNEGSVSSSDFARRLNRKTAPLKISAKLVGETSGTLAQLVYRDDGRGADRIAGDGIYSASYTLPKNRAPKLGLAESVAVHVQAQSAKGEYRGALGGFLYSNPGARLTGRYKDEMRDGNMVVSAEVEVLTPGRYHLAGTMSASRSGGDSQPMAWAQNAAELKPGKQWIDLSYYGLIFHDMNAPGPYTMSSMALTSALGMPNAMSSVKHDVYSMATHDMSEFRSQPFNDSMLLDTIQRTVKDAGAQ